MHITKLRLLGFKSFVEPTELLIERGLTGVVGPNGCGKSNLLEALRWTMGETSYKSMRASSMDDVIFNGTTTRPARNMAEVTLYVDNAARTAPAEFNAHDILEITRRIEREMGSAYRVNGREVRARDVKILFDDAATGARSPALVRQGQIGEIVNAKPEQRRRILEDAAGIAGLHTRRHEAELRLKAADANLARVQDMLGQLDSQLESLKRQARQARRYKEISGDIRKAEALLLHVIWIAIEADVTAAEAEFGTALAALAGTVEREATLVTAEHAAATALPDLRKAEAERAAALQRIKLELEAYERELTRAALRRTELDERTAQARRDLEREDSLVREADTALASLTRERTTLDAADAGAVAAETKSASALADAERAAASMEQRLAGLQMAAAEVRARRTGLARDLTEATALVDRLSRQCAAATADLVAAEPSATAHDDLSETRARFTRAAATLADLDAQLATADAARETAAATAATARTAANAAVLADKRLETEITTLEKLLPALATGTDAAALLDELTVAPGYEHALMAALGDDLLASADTAADMHWRLLAPAEGDPPLPPGIVPLTAHVRGPAVLVRRLAQIGMIEPIDADRIQTALAVGQRLVSQAGDLWRWDGFVAAAGTSAAAQRLTERNRLASLHTERSKTHHTAEAAAAADRRAAEALAAAEATLRRLQAAHREARAETDEARFAVGTLETRTRETDDRRRRAQETHAALTAALADAESRRDEATIGLDTLADTDTLDEQLTATLETASEQRSAVAEARAAHAALERFARDRAARRATIAEDVTSWENRRATATERVDLLRDRILTAEEERAASDTDPAEIEERRQALLDLAAEAETARARAADALAAADTAFRDAQLALRAVQSDIALAREGKVRAESRVEVARQRRIDHVRKVSEMLNVLPDACLGLSGHADTARLPSLQDLDATLARLKAERDRLGDVNLAADDDLTTAQGRFDTLDAERADVEAAIAKLRGAIADLNKEAKGRLDTAFRQVDAHFQRLFGILFGGGEARLEMIEAADDPLQGGLEIVAKPPGKKPATLSLLSGGEQTLTALSLIFAVFLTNPSPICVLDEVDAPLDDSNVDRFCTLMERMAADTDTRFLVITHHPLTMARMHRLFGVTMAEKGVSQLVSVDLQAAQSFVESEAA